MEFNFKLSLEQANIILNALAKEPYNVVFSVIETISKQANEQTAQNQPTTPTDKAK
jgi:hypothetical protein